MDMFSTEYLLSLGAIVLLDLVLGGDNAIIIGMAAHKLPEATKRKVIYYGIAGALIIRTVMTVAAVELLDVPFLQFLGGLLLLPIAFKLGNPAEEEHSIDQGSSFWGAIKIILVADALMGIDNVLAIAGASKGDFSLIVLGLLISIPILIWGSQFITKLIHKFSFLVQVGALVLAWTSASMMLDDPIVGNIFREYFGNIDVIFSVGLLLIVFIGINYRKIVSKK